MKNTTSLKNKYEFKKILYKGKYYSIRDIVVYIQTNSLNGKNMLGICVSKKNGGSVERNKLKRWAREAYLKLEPFTKKQYNIIILYKKTANIENMSFIKVLESMKECFKKLNIYYEDINDEKVNY